MTTLSNLNNNPINLVLQRGSSYSLLFTFEDPSFLTDITPEAYVYGRRIPEDTVPLSWAKLDSLNLEITFPESVTTTFKHSSANWVVLLHISDTQTDCLVQGQVDFKGISQ